MRIVIIEDNQALANGIAYQLQDIGHAVDVLYDGAHGQTYLRDNGADLVILDLNLGAINGLEILKDIRTRKDKTPVLILTARSDIEDRVKGLDAGADDYLIKPFEMSELEARLRALFRRKLKEQPVSIHVGALTFDRSARQLMHQEKKIELPRRELALFECLLDRVGRLTSKTTIADHLYGVGADINETVVEVYVSRLRKRLMPYSISIQVARGIGYMLDDES